MTFCPPNTHYPLILWGKLFLSPPCALISFVPPGKNHEIAMNMRRHARYVSWAYPAYLGCARHVSRAYLTCLEHPRYVSRAYPAYLGFPRYVSRVYPSYLCGCPVHSPEHIHDLPRDIQYIHRGTLDAAKSVGLFTQVNIQHWISRYSSLGYLYLCIHGMHLWSKYCV